MIASRFALPLLLAFATAFADWKVVYRPGNTATSNPPSAFDMSGNLWIWTNTLGSLHQVAQGKDSAATTNASTGIYMPMNFTATGAGRLAAAFSYTAIVTSNDSGKRWDTMAVVARNYGIAAGRGLWMAPSLVSYRGKNTAVLLSGSWGSKKVDTSTSTSSIGLNLGFLPGDVPLEVRTWSTSLGVRYMSFHALKSPTDTSAGTILDTIAPKGSQRGMACNAAGCLFATDDSVWVVRSAPYSVTGFPAPATTTNMIKSVALTSGEAWVSTSGNGTQGVWRRPLSGGGWTLDNAGLGADSTKGSKLVSDGARVALVGSTQVYLNTSGSNRAVRLPGASGRFSLRGGRIELDLAAGARGSLEVRSLDGRNLFLTNLEALGAGHHSIPVANRGVHLVRLRTPQGETVRTGWF